MTVRDNVTTAAASGFMIANNSRCGEFMLISSFVGSCDALYQLNATDVDSMNMMDWLGCAWCYPLGIVRSDLQQSTA